MHPTHPTHPTQSTHPTQATHRRHRTHPTMATHIRKPTQNKVRTLPATPALPAVATLPATATLPDVATDPATARLPAVAIEPATATLPAVAIDPATAKLPAVESFLGFDLKALDASSRQTTFASFRSADSSFDRRWCRNRPYAAYAPVAAPALRSVGSAGGDHAEIGVVGEEPVQAGAQERADLADQVAHGNRVGAAPVLQR